ncbi:MAG: CFI-box-CTERM domain-containing protein, partial [Flavobacterium sp.]
EKAVLFIVLDPTIEFPEKLKEKGFQKSNNIFLSHFKNVWEYNKKQINTSKSKIESNGKCFIATATVGSYDHPEVMELRNFRDNWILEKKWGESFVKWYYHYGAKAAKVIEKSFVLKKISYFIIVKPLYILSKILNN